ncbi:MAG: zinc-dependent peptidase [Planctomycetes bacterium]|nr:zinc-dependent peptidase [Planctomycetota bacterium]
MLVTPASNRSNHYTASIFAVMTGLLLAGLGYFNHYILVAFPLVAAVYWYIRRRTKRRMTVIKAPFPEEWEHGLQTHVDFFLALDETQRQRFRNLIKVFLDEVPITGVRTDVDELCRVLVAASAVIPIFGFDDWEYSRLGEILIYPGAFDDDYRTDDEADPNTLGMVGVNHLSGVMILSKPSLIAGFANSKDKRNVGIHEFAHLVDKADGAVDGLPAGIPRDVVHPWIEWVGGELKRPVNGNDHIDDYAFTNEAEYFAVLTEYFFEAPEVLARRDPETYKMMEAMYRQNTRALLSRSLLRRPKRVGRNAPCPCGSGKKYKRCCRSGRKIGLPVAT